MVRFNQMGLIGVISLLVLAGCNQAQQSPQTPPASGANSSAPSVPASPDAATTLPQTTQADDDTLLLNVLDIRAAVEAGDFAKAQTEFDEFDESWEKVEDGIKDKSPDGYTAIEESMDAVRAALNEAQPNNEKVFAALQELEANVISAQ
jgi:hypothetical protein